MQKQEYRKSTQSAWSSLCSQHDLHFGVSVHTNTKPWRPCLPVEMASRTLLPFFATTCPHVWQKHVSLGNQNSKLWQSNFKFYFPTWEHFGAKYANDRSWLISHFAGHFQQGAPLSSKLQIKVIELVQLHLYGKGRRLCIDMKTVSKVVKQFRESRSTAPKPLNHSWKYCLSLPGYVQDLIQLNIIKDHSQYPTEIPLLILYHSVWFSKL